MGLRVRPACLFHWNEIFYNLDFKVKDNIRLEYQRDKIKNRKIMSNHEHVVGGGAKPMVSSMKRHISTCYSWS